jgi:hypothetical protein
MDVWGLPQPVAPRLAKRYDDLFTIGVEALRAFRQEVKGGTVVPAESAVKMPDDEFDRFVDLVG